jgi:GT2 family glycosyltransferase
MTMASSVRTHVLVVNLNSLNFIKNCMSDLLKQDCNFKITIVDQASTEEGIHEYYKTFENFKNIQIVYNTYNKPLNHIWNWFYEEHHEEFLCFLNNDVRVPKNFISDSERLFDTRPDIGITFHSTNHHSYTKQTQLGYEAYNDIDISQGWDYTIRRKIYKNIPQQLKFYAGDAYIFAKVYEQGFKSACIFSSPMIHYQGVTGNKFAANNEWKIDLAEYAKLKIGNTVIHPEKYCKLKPDGELIKIWLENNK